MSHWLQIQLNQGFVFNTRLGLAWHRPGELQTAKVWKVSVQFRFSKECHQRTQSKMLEETNRFTSAAAIFVVVGNASMDLLHINPASY